MILSGAVNTSLIGVNGVLNRVAEDGVLLDWFRKPQKKYGTTFRILNTIDFAPDRNHYREPGGCHLLGEAYAFGVVWSFALKSLGVLVLRYQRHDQEYKFPFNSENRRQMRYRWVWARPRWCCFWSESPTSFSKRIATIYGISFTIVLLRSS